MPIGPTSIRFLGNGRETRPFKNLRVNREPTRKGIERSNPKTIGEFNQLSLALNGLKDPESLGRAAVGLIQNGGGIDLLA